MKKLPHPALCVILVMVAVLNTRAADTPVGMVTYNRDIRPLLSKNCFACHGQDEQKREAELRLDTGSNEAIVPGKPDESEMWKRIVSTDPDEVMPPPDSHKSLTEEEKQTIRRWLELGANYEEHWAFISITKPDVLRSDVTNPIDAFIQSRLTQENLQPAPVANKEALIRRVTLDLTGLPPTPDEVDAFLNDDSDEAYEKLVNNLQNRVTYGEHMARYWLDLARYADTHGLHLDNERSMWPYRDWVVKAINQNLPFDEFTRWQLAGDLLPEPTREQLIASGFNRCNVTTGEGGSIAQEWIYRYAVERTSATSEVWMGLTAGCAVCHDHKFDPLSTKEFYSMYAFFHSAADPAMDGNKIDTPPILKLIEPEQEKQIAELDQQMAETEKEIHDLIGQVVYVEPSGDEAAKVTESWIAWTKQAAGDRNKNLTGDLRKLVKGRDADKWTVDETDTLLRHWLRTVHSATKEALKPLEEKKVAASKQKSAIEKSIPLTLVMADLKKPRESFVMLRGAYDNPGEKVTRGVPGFLPQLPKQTERNVNRLDLANWLVSPQHPLTSRVTVNRFWQQFFGTGLVETSEDFGTQGQQPSHPELLDWLAWQFMDDGWDMKRLVKRIVTSHTYRQDSRVDSSLLVRDPANRLLARGPRLRLDAEVLRDQALFVGKLLVPKVGGAGVKPYQPPNIWEPVGFGSSNTRYYKQGTGDELYRRSLYTFMKRTAPPPFMSSFDAPNREQSCSRRSRSNTPMQALQLMNDVQHVEAARHFAERIVQQSDDDSKRIRWAWRVVTARYPDAEEIQIATQVLNTHRQRYVSDEAAAKELISYGESKPNADLKASELAAWTMLANLVLNLDESVNKN